MPNNKQKLKDMFHDFISTKGLDLDQHAQNEFGAKLSAILDELHAGAVSNSLHKKIHAHHKLYVIFNELNRIRYTAYISSIPKNELRAKLSKALIAATSSANVLVDEIFVLKNSETAVDYMLLSLSVKHMHLYDIVFKLSEIFARRFANNYLIHSKSAYNNFYKKISEELMQLTIQLCSDDEIIKLIISITTFSCAESSNNATNISANSIQDPAVFIAKMNDGCIAEWNNDIANMDINKILEEALPNLKIDQHTFNNLLGAKSKHAYRFAFLQQMNCCEQLSIYAKSVSIQHVMSFFSNNCNGAIVEDLLKFNRSIMIRISTQALYEKLMNGLHNYLTNTCCASANHNSSVRALRL